MSSLCEVAKAEVKKNLRTLIMEIIEEENMKKKILNEIRLLTIYTIIPAILTGFVSSQYKISYYAIDLFLCGISAKFIFDKQKREEKKATFRLLFQGEFWIRLIVAPFFTGILSLVYYRFGLDNESDSILMAILAQHINLIICLVYYRFSMSFLFSIFIFSLEMVHKSLSLENQQNLKSFIEGLDDAKKLRKSELKFGWKKELSSCVGCKCHCNQEQQDPSESPTVEMEEFVINGEFIGDNLGEGGGGGDIFREMKINTKSKEEATNKGDNDNLIGDEDLFHEVENHGEKDKNC